jgi:predicted phosphate transport protein (TIGR00153 family)
MTTLINKNENKENVEKDKGDFKLTDHYRPFLDVVAKSPFEAVEKHAKHVHKCVNTMHQMFDLYIDGKFEEARALWTQIQDAEHEADIIKNTIRDKLQKSLFMPISRQQITRILTLQDRLADAAEDVSDMLAARDTKIPEEVKPLFREHLDIVMNAVNTLEQAVDDVDKLMDSHFRKKDVLATQNKLHRVSELEWKADKVKRELRRKIFELEGKESPVAIYHMIKIIRRVDDIANHAENVEGFLRVVIQK